MTHLRAYLLFLGLLICIMTPSLDGLKMILATDDACGRYTLDALYHEQYAPDTEAILDGCKQFATQITDLVLESLQEVSLKLPGKSSSTEKDRLLFKRYTYRRDNFIKKIDKIQTNITNAWKTLVQKNHDFMAAKDISSPDQVISAVRELYGAYNGSRKVLDDSFASFISEFKSLVRTGIKAIEGKVDNEIMMEKMRKERMAQENTTSTEEEEEDDDDFDEDDEATIETEDTNGIEDERVQNEINEEQTHDHSKHHNHEHHGHHHHHHEQNETNPDEDLPRDERIKKVIRDVVPSFLGNVSIMALERNIDLYEEIESTINSRDLPLDDILYDITLLKGRVISTLSLDYKDDEDMLNLVRRNLYMYFSQQAQELYKKKTKKKNSLNKDSQTPSLNSTQVAERFIDLMKSYNVEAVKL